MNNEQLLASITALNQPYGLEKSVKLFEKTLLDQRYLLSLHKNAFGDPSIKGLFKLIQAFAIPSKFLAEIEQQLPETNIVHLGYERTVDGEVIKLYLEFAEVFEGMTQSNGSEELVPVHIAYKWDPQRPNKNNIAHYQYRPRQTLEQMKQTMSAMLPDELASTSLQLAENLLTHAAQRLPLEELMLLEVREKGNPRHSFDLKLYDTDLKLNDIATPLTELVEEFDINPHQLSELLLRHGGDELGHFSAGTSREGRPFFSLYFGIEGY